MSKAKTIKSIEEFKEFAPKDIFEYFEKDVLKYLSTRIGVDLDLYKNRFSHKEFSEMEAYTSYNSEDKTETQTIRMEVGWLDVKELGPFRHIIESAQVHLRISYTVGRSDTVTIIPSFRYQHPKGGSNGHDMDFRLRWIPILSKLIEY